MHSLRDTPGVGLLGEIAPPRPATGTPPLLDSVIPLSARRGAMPHGYGRLVVVLRQHRQAPLSSPGFTITDAGISHGGVPAGASASIALSALGGRGFLGTPVGPAQVSANGAACWADVPAGTWTVTWATPDGPQYVIVDVVAARTQGFTVAV